MPFYLILINLNVLKPQAAGVYNIRPQNPQGKMGREETGGCSEGAMETAQVMKAKGLKPKGSNCRGGTP